jgi:hypothetical protein
MHEAFWNGLLDTRWEDAPLGPVSLGKLCEVARRRRCRDPSHL